MKQDAFLAAYEQLVSAPGGMNQLRRIILDLAIRGHFSSQVHEPEKSWRGLETDGHDPEILRSTWTHLTFAEAVGINQWGRAQAAEISTDSWIVDLEDVEKGTGKVAHFVTAGDRVPSSAKSIFRAGDVLYGKLRPYLNKVLVA